MRLYFAGIPAGAGQEDAFCSLGGVQHRLLSFAELSSWGKNAFEFWLSERAPRPFFLDSGAFGALTRGAVIDLQQYCEWIKQHETHLCAYAALDVIGDYRGSAKNLDIMLEVGLHPIPTFHYDSPDHELKRLLAMTDHIALGGVVGAQEAEMRVWLDNCFSIIKDFWPVKIHIFGVMAQWALERYPAYSADSSSALVSAGMGRVMMFQEGRITGMDWKTYARTYYDGSVMDGIAEHRSLRGVGSAHRGRSILNCQAQIALERHVTAVWKYRGFVWEDNA